MIDSDFRFIYGVGWAVILVIGAVIAVLAAIDGRYGLRKIYNQIIKRLKS